jgi:phage recombination protein Bet
MSTEVATRTEPAATTSPQASVPAVVSPLPTRAVAPAAAREFSDAQLEIIRANGGHQLEAGELEAFLHVVRRTGLDPLARQIYAVKRYSSKEKREIMTIQTGIDGYRLVADRTGRYAPSERPPEITVDDDGRPARVMFWVKKLTDDGSWHEVWGMATFAEFSQTDKDGKLTPFWEKMPENQLTKCAEAAALRKAFPNDLSGVWTTETAPREDFDVEVSVEPRRAIAAPKARSAAALPPPAAAKPLTEDERRFVVTPTKTVEKESAKKKPYWILHAQSGETFSAFRKDHVTAFRVAMDRGWQVEVIEKKNGSYWNVEKVTPVEPPAAAAAPPTGEEQPGSVPAPDPVDELFPA